MNASVRNGGHVTTIEKTTPTTHCAGRLKGMDALRLQSAPLALKKAHELCSGQVGDDSSFGRHTCQIIHGSWQYLLLLGMAATPERSLKFYRQAIRAAARKFGFRRILISGCCDYTMLAIVLDAFKGLDLVPQITASDRCDTPLYLCRWYAERHGCEVTTQKADILTYAPDEPFDILCTDGLISNFYPDARAGLVGAWHGLLRPGGLVVTANNIHTGRLGERMELPPETIATLCDEAVRRKAKSPIGPNLSDETLRGLARDFYTLPRVPSVGTTQELESLFRPDQFRIEQFAISEIDGNALRDADETGHVRRTLNARIVASRL